MQNAKAEQTTLSGAGVISSKAQRPLAIVIEPVRDLAEQVCQSFDALKGYLTNPSLLAGVFVGGVDPKPQVS